MKYTTKSGLEISKIHRNFEAVYAILLIARVKLKEIGKEIWSHDYAWLAENDALMDSVHRVLYGMDIGQYGLQRLEQISELLELTNLKEKYGKRNKSRI